MKNLIKLLTILSICLFSVMPALADGEETSGGFKEYTVSDCETEYGGGVTCKDRVVREIVPEASPEPSLDQYDTGIAEVATIATLLFLGGLTALALAQRQLKA